MGWFSFLLGKAYVGLFYGINFFTNHISEDVELTKFYLWTNQNYNQLQELEFTEQFYRKKESVATSKFNVTNPTVFIVHGLADNGKADWVIHMKNEFLNKGISRVGLFS